MAERHEPHAHAAPQANDAAAARHEDRDVDIRAVVGFAAALVVVTIGLAVLAWGLYGALDAREAHQAPRTFPLAVDEENRVPPEPRLQTNPREDLRELRDQEDRILATYGWVDRGAGVVRIPIDEAMRLTLQRGLPSRREAAK